MTFAKSFLSSERLASLNSEVHWEISFLQALSCSLLVRRRLVKDVMSEMAIDKSIIAIVAPGALGASNQSRGDAKFSPA